MDPEGFRNRTFPQDRNGNAEPSGPVRRQRARPPQPHRSRRFDQNDRRCEGPAAMADPDDQPAFAPLGPPEREIVAGRFRHAGTRRDDRRMWRRACRNGEREPRFAGDANILADLITHMHTGPERPGRIPDSRLHRQGKPAAIATGLETETGEYLRRRPGDAHRIQVLRALPVKHRRQPRCARRAPEDFPARFEIEAQAQPTAVLRAAAGEQPQPAFRPVEPWRLKTRRRDCGCGCPRPEAQRQQDGANPPCPALEPDWPMAVIGPRRNGFACAARRRAYLRERPAMQKAGSP